MDTKPRKKPRQSRSRATYEAIVEATTQLLVKEGFDRFTTARVASRAGVSIGSLYQYFPNKTALAAAVIDRCCEEFLRHFEASLARASGKSLEAAVRIMVHTSLASHHLAPELHRIVNELARRIGVDDRTNMVSKATAKLIEALLREHSDELAAGADPMVAATIIETVLEALAHRVQLADPPRVPDGVLAEEATRLIVSYLSA